VDAGDLEHGVESTVIDARGDSPILLRPGAVTPEELEACCGRAVVMPAVGGVARSPGMRYRHYSPRAEVWLYPPGASSTPRFRDDARQLRSSGRRVAAIANYSVEADHFIPLPANTRELGRRLFGWLRELDELGVDHNLEEGVSAVGVGRAIMDRLERAASRIHGSEPDGAAPGGSSL
jgi:L-threonylcarbamoyladenylate synthase